MKSSVWIEEDWHQIQPNMPSNIDYTSTEEIKNNNVRIWSEYKNEKNKIKYSLGAGYVHDKQLYDKQEDNIIQTDRLVLRNEISHDITP